MHHTLLRSLLMRIIKAFSSAQVCSLIDFAITVFLSSVVGIYYVAATAIGSVCGGICNCIINYRWVFPKSGSKKCYIAIKYLTVWVLSIVFNTYGTYLLTEVTKNSSFLVGLLGSYNDHIYIVYKCVVAILVAFLWNYPMQRFFVYRRIHLNIKKNKI